MIKIIALVKRKKGLSKEDFISYYETHHAPLAIATLPMGNHYRRNYVLQARAEGREVDGEPDYDCVTEIGFETKDAHEKFQKAMSVPETYAMIRADEDRFVDRSALRSFLVEERKS